MDITIFEKQERSIRRVLKFGNNFTINEISDIRDEILKSLSDKMDLELDLREVKECDVAGIQVLLSLTKTMKDQKKSVLIEGASNAVLNSAIRLGIDPEEFLRAQEA